MQLLQQKREASTIPWNLDDKWLEDAKKWVQEEPKPDDKLVTEASKWLEPAEKWMEEKLEEEPDDKWLEDAKKWVQDEPKPDDKLVTEASKWLESAEKWWRKSLRKSLLTSGWRQLPSGLRQRLLPPSLMPRSGQQESG
ncbi:hypothetical protein CASFOL_036025 [Castilleja foliolosa]|uniref:Uncharacterized protein n=1 Tax=Castilleja foliolosa TaxID=1961234 RepID=A0ABD3BUI7_9LAMI